MERVIKTVAVNEPVNEPVKLVELKEFLRMEVDDLEVEDSLLYSLIYTARDWVERETGKLLITQTWNIYLENFPSENYINLPFSPLQSVSSVKYTDSDGSVSTWDNTKYIVDTLSYTPRIVLDWQESWPDTDLYPSNPINIEAIFGYGLNSTSVPSPLKQAILLLCSHWYDIRSIMTKDSVDEIPFNINALISKYKRFRL